MKKGYYIFVKRNDEYIHSYQIRRFNKTKGPLIIAISKRSGISREYDYYQELNSDMPPNNNLWRNASGELVKYSEIEDNNTFKWADSEGVKHG